MALSCELRKTCNGIKTVQYETRSGIKISRIHGAERPLCCAQGLERRAL